MKQSLSLKSVTKVFGTLVIMSCAACGGSGGGNDVAVVTISSDSHVFPVGGGSVVAVGITFDAGRVTSGGDIHAVVRLPAQLRYRSHSAEVDGFTSADDNNVNPIVTDCQTSEQFLAFTFSHSDLLRAANPSGDADMRLNLTVDGVAATQVARIQASADENLPAFTCGQEFAADKDEDVQVQ